MSIKSFSLIIAMGLLTGFLAVQFWSASHRSPASEVAFSRPRVLAWGAEKYGKTSQAMEVRISTVGGVPDKDSQELHLKAEVTLNQKVEGDVSFRWVLPEDVSVVSGETEDVWTNLKVGQTATADLVVLNISKEGFPKTVTLNVTAIGSGVHFGGSGSFATNSYLQMTAAAAEEKDSAGNKLNPDLRNSEENDKIKRMHQ